MVVYPKQEVPKIDKVNKLYPAMADAVTFKYEEKRGNANFRVNAFFNFWKSVPAITLYQNVLTISCRLRKNQECMTLPSAAILST